MGEGTDASDVSLGAETAKATAAKFSMAAIGFIGTIIFARELGPEKFGAYYLLFSLVKIADLPIEGWSMAAKKRFSEAGTNTSEIVGGQFAFVVLWVTIGVGGAVLAAPYLVTYTGVSASVPLFVALLCGEAVYVSAERLLQARGLIGKATWTDALRSYVTFGLQLALVLTGWGVAGMAYGLAAASLIVTPLTIYFVGVRPELPSQKTLVRHWRFARYSLPSTLFGRVYERFDVLLLGFLLGPTAAGWYEVAFKIVAPAKFVADAASSGLMARVSLLSSRGEPISEDVTNVLSYASILSVPIFFGALAVAEPLVVTIYGPAYAPSALLLIVIALYHIVMTQNMPLGQTVYGLDFPQRIMWISAGSVAINVALGFTLIPVVGAVGAAISTLVAESLTYAFLAYTLHRIGYGVRFLPPAFLKQGLVGVVMLIIIIATFSRDVPTGVWHVAPVLAVGSFLYLLMLFGVSRELRTTVRAVLADVGLLD